MFFTLVSVAAAFLSAEAHAQTAPLAPAPIPVPRLSEPQLQAVLDLDRSFHQKVAGVVEDPTSQTPSSVTFLFDSRRLNPGETLYLVVPQALRSGAVDFVVLSHRQDPAFDRSHVRSFRDQDSTPGYTSVQFLDLGYGDEDHWRYWKGPSSEKNGAKFAEVRKADHPEVEGLYSWRHYGHGSVYGDIVTKDPLHASMIRLVSTGVDPVFIDELQMKIAPRQAPDRTIEHIYTPGTVLGDYATGEGQAFGGGEWHKGVYPNAWRVSDDDGKIVVDLPVGVKITSADVAAGDARGMEAPTHYRRGGGKLTVRWIRGGATLFTLVDGENLGPQGLIRGIPTNPQTRTQAGDQIEISGGSSTCYIMGYRIGIKD